MLDCDGRPIHEAGNNQSSQNNILSKDSQAPRPRLDITFWATHWSDRK